MSSFLKMATVVFCATVLAPAVNAKPAPPTSAAATLEADLDVLANFVPRQSLRDVMMGGCTTSYRKKLDAEAEAERALPGLHDHMVAGASAYCVANVDSLIERVRIRAKERWKSRFTPAELHRLAVLYAPSLKPLEKFRVEFKPGDTATGAVRRADPSLYRDTEDWKRRAMAFAATPGGASLLTRGDSESKTIAAGAESQDDLVTFIKTAFRAGRVAANTYAAEKGMQPLYAE